MTDVCPYCAPWKGSAACGRCRLNPPGLMLSLQALLAVKPVSVEEDQEPEVPTHPEDGTPQPGNSKVRRENPSMGCQWRPMRVPRQPRLMETQPGQRLSLCEARGLCCGTESHCGALTGLELSV